MNSLCCIHREPIDRECSRMPGSRSSKMVLHVDSKGRFNESLKNSTNMAEKNMCPAVSMTAAKQLGSAANGASLDQNAGPTLLTDCLEQPKNTSDGPFMISQLAAGLVEMKDNRTNTGNALNCPVGPSVVGILYKWVNYGRGWRPRWFVLQDEVLSYYKVHGRYKVVKSENHKGIKVIGAESERFMRKRCGNPNTDDTRPRKTVGELHLKVSSIRNSKADDKKFYIFTGTKTLHLRAETREDRTAWLEALNVAKDLFPKGSTINNLFEPFEDINISTGRLRNCLLEEGLRIEAISECENIMLTEFFELQGRLKSLQQSNIYLIERLRQLEAEKVELETTVVDESQSHDMEGDGSRRLENEKDCEGSGTESDEDIEKKVGVDPCSDEDYGIFFDSKEFPSGSYYRQNLANSVGDMPDPEDSSFVSLPEDTETADIGIECFGCDYPFVERRKRLPVPKEKEKGISLWSLIKDNIGKDLTRVCLPVYFNEPISSLQKCFEDLEYSHLLDQAYEWGKRGDNLMRMLNVAAFAVSGYSSTEGRTCKPFNPLLGETYEADYPDKGLRFFSEKVSHHPMIVACHCEGRGWKFWGDNTVKSKFWGRSIQLYPVGILTLEFDDGEVFQWSKVTTTIYNLILGKLYCDHCGVMRIQGNRELSCRIKFKEQSIIDRNPHQVQGYVQDRGGKTMATLIGKWDESMHFIRGDAAMKSKGYDCSSEATLLWKRNKPAEYPARYNLTSFAITLNELTPGLKEKLPPTDSRLRPDQRLLENGEYEQAFAEKLRLEQKQRQAQKLQEGGWQPRWFHKADGKDTYEYVGGYWEAREQCKWVDSPDIFGPGLALSIQE
eukprot:c27954_g2_i1 orf=519-3035(+)